MGSKNKERQWYGVALIELDGNEGKTSQAIIKKDGD